MDIVSITKKIIKNSFTDYFIKKNLFELDTEHVLLDRIFPKERRISSIMGGLQTSLGTRLWENLAIEIALHNGFLVKSKNELRQPAIIPERITNEIARWSVAREQANANISLSGFVGELKSSYPNPAPLGSEFVNITKGEGVDLFFEKDGCEYAFDIKTVQINAGSGVKFNRTLMKWYAYRIFEKGAVNFKAAIVFPYNPYIGGDWWAAQAGRVYPLDRSDVFVENEFWSFISGDVAAWQKIVSAFRDLDHEGFAELYRPAFYEADDYFKARIVANKTGCELLPPTNDENEAMSRRARVRLRWRCPKCLVEFKATVLGLNKAGGHACQG
jgi:hypothetical protein